MKPQFTIVRPGARPEDFPPGTLIQIECEKGLFWGRFRSAKAWDGFRHFIRVDAWGLSF